MQPLSDEWWNRLSQSERASIFAYTGGTGNDSDGNNIKVNYAELNRLLRSDKLDENMKWIVKNIDSGLSKFDLKDDAKFMRGMSHIELEDLMDKQIMKSYKSLTTSKKVANNFSKKDWLVEFNVPKGKNGAFIGSNSKFTSEDEFLLARGKKVKLVEINEEKRTAVFEVVD